MTTVTVTLKHTRDNAFHSIDPRIEVQNTFIGGFAPGISMLSVVGDQFGFSSHPMNDAFSHSGPSFPVHSPFDDDNSELPGFHSHFGHSYHAPLRTMGYDPFPSVGGRNHSPQISQFFVQFSVDASVSAEKFKEHLARTVRFSNNIRVIGISELDHVAHEHQQYKKSEQEEKMLSAQFSNMRASFSSDDDFDSAIGAPPTAFPPESSAQVIPVKKDSKEDKAPDAAKLTLSTGPALFATHVLPPETKQNVNPAQKKQEFCGMSRGFLKGMF